MEQLALWTWTANAATCYNTILDLVLAVFVRMCYCTVGVGRSMWSH